MNVVQEIQRINDRELKLGIAGTSASWHEEYARSAWVYVGGLAYSLSEGDVLCIFSQWGEIEDMHLVRDDDTGKSKGFAFIKYLANSPMYWTHVALYFAQWRKKFVALNFFEMTAVHPSMNTPTPSIPPAEWYNGSAVYNTSFWLMPM